MKMNWGTGIGLFYIFFVVATVSVVLFTTTIDVNLVTEDYYEQELAFQNQIDKAERTKALPEKPTLALTGSNVYIKFPSSLKRDLIEGTIYFYRPSDRRQDFRVPVSLNQHGEQIVKSADLTQGLWRVYIDWNINDAKYLSEKIIMVN